jgi:phage terminase large subunit-like protein
VREEAAIQGLSREVREELARIETEKAGRRYRRPLDYLYKPHSTQLTIHKIDWAKVVSLFSANRFGKSLTGLAEILWRMEGDHPYKKVKRAPVHMWIVTPSNNFFEETVVKGLWPYWGPRDKSVSLSRSPQIEFRHINGSTATVMSTEMALDKFMGAAVDFAWIDEQCPQEKYEEIMVRLTSTGGDCIYTATLVKGLGWEYEGLWLPGQSGHPNIASFAGALCRRDPTKELEIGEILVPHLNHDAVLMLARQISGRTGLILPYDELLNTCDRFSIPNHWPVWIGLDPGFYGFAASFQAAGDGDVTFIWDEYHSQRDSVYVRALALSDKCRKLYRDWDEPIPVFVDCEDQQVIHELNIQFQQIIEDEPHSPRLAATSLEYKKKAIRAGISRMQWALYPDSEMRYPEKVLEHRGKYGCPHLLIFNDIESSFVDHRGTFHTTCRHAWEMGRWAWKKAAEGHMIKDEPDDYQADGAHMMAALRYGLMTRFGALAPPMEKTQYTGPWYNIMQRLGQIEEDEYGE